MKNYIEVLLKGQWNSDTKVLYGYPSAAAPSGAYVPDPRSLKRLLCRVDAHCYAIYRSDSGVYYSYLFPSNDFRQGDMSLTIFVRRGSAVTGVSILRELEHLRGELFEKRAFEHADEAHALVAASVSRLEETPMTNLMPSHQATSAMTQSPYGYREYRTHAELEELFTFTYQQEYAQFEKVLFVDPQMMQGVDARIRRVQSPLMRYYYLSSPSADIKSEKSVIAEAETTAVVYTKAGYKPLRVAFSLKESSLYHRVGNVLRLRGVEELRLPFTKVLKLQVCSEDGTPLAISAVESILLGGKSARPTAEGYFEVELKYSEPMNALQLDISARLYKRVTKVVDLSQKSHDEVIRLMLSPQKQAVKMSLVFDDWRSQPFTMEFNESDEAYRMLREQQLFFGYAAERDGLEYVVRMPRGKHRSAVAGGVRRQGTPWWVWAVVAACAVSVAVATFFGVLYMLNQKGSAPAVTPLIESVEAPQGDTIRLAEPVIANPTEGTVSQPGESVEPQQTDGTEPKPTESTEPQSAEGGKAPAKDAGATAATSEAGDKGKTDSPSK